MVVTRSSCTRSATTRPSPLHFRRATTARPGPGPGGVLRDRVRPGYRTWVSGRYNGFGEAALPERFATADSYQVLSTWREYQTPGSTSRCCTMAVGKRLDGIKAILDPVAAQPHPTQQDDTFVLHDANAPARITEGPSRPYLSQTTAAPTGANGISYVAAPRRRPSLDPRRSPTRAWKPSWPRQQGSQTV